MVSFRKVASRRGIPGCAAAFLLSCSLPLAPPGWLQEAAAQAACDPTAPESRLESVVQAWAWNGLGIELWREDTLREVAREHSLVLASEVDIDTREFLRQAQNQRGLLDPFPYVFCGSVPEKEIPALEKRLLRNLRGLSPGEQRLFTHVAVGIEVRSRWTGWLQRQRLAYVTVLLTQRALSFAALPSDLRPGDRFLFEGEVHAPFRAPEVLLTRPDGNTRVLDNLSLEPQRFRAYVSFDDGPGEYQLEVMGRYDMGPRVLGLCSLYPRQPGEVAPYALWLRAARSGHLVNARAAGAQQPEPRTEEEAEARLLGLVNRDRRRSGLQPLEADAALAAMARAHSCDMRDHGFFAHVSPRTGRLVERAASAGIRYRRLAENIAVNRDVDAAEAALLRSPGHRMNLLSADFTRVGVGVAFDRDLQGNLRAYVTQAFLVPAP